MRKKTKVLFIHQCHFGNVYPVTGFYFNVILQILCHLESAAHTVCEPVASLTCRSLLEMENPRFHPGSLNQNLYMPEIHESHLNHQRRGPMHSDLVRLVGEG